MVALATGLVVTTVLSASALTRTPSPTPTRIPTVTTDRGRWDEKAPMSTARTDAFIAAVDGRIYAFGGFLQMPDPNVRTAVGEVYDPVTDTWEARAPMLRARAAGRAITVGESLYAIGGSDHDFASETIVEVYDVATDTWSERAVQGNIIPNSILAAELLGDYIYVLVRPEQGFDRVLVYAYDFEGDTWDELPVLTLTPAGLSLAAFDGSLLLFSTPTRRVHRYDPDPGDLLDLGEIPQLRGISAFQTVRADRALYGFAGDPDGTVMEYNPVSNNWRGPLQDVPMALGFASQFVSVPVNGETRIYAMGSYDDPFNLAYTLPRGLLAPSPTPTPTPTATATPSRARPASDSGGCAVAAAEQPSWNSWFLLALSAALVARVLQKRFG